MFDNYKSQSVVTEPGKFAELFDTLPNSIPELVDIVQGLVVDKDFLKLYAETLTDELALHKLQVG
jgi:hypothetical protein